MNSYLKAMRFGRWPRSLAILPGIAAFFFLHRSSLASTSKLWILFQAAFAFLLTWAISTSNYIINEIVDAPYDIHHPTKRYRPLIQGEIRKGPFLLLGGFFAIAGLVLALTLFSFPFFLSLLALLIAGFIYNMKPIRTKDIPFLDSISESANNPIRFLIGWFAFSSSKSFPPISLLLSWWLFGNFLMIAKRFSEFRYLKEKAGDYRESLRKYSAASLILGITSSSVAFFVCYFIFALSFKLQSFIYFSPLIIVYFIWIIRKTLKEKEVMEEPQSLLRRPLFALYTLLIVLLFFLSYYVDTLGQ
jgi:decaprenyl-phosphate phosphoribosyltransferase